MMRPWSRISFTYASGSPVLATSSSIGEHARGRAAVQRALQRSDGGRHRGRRRSAPVDAVIRAVKVDAFRPCSAVQIQ